MSKVGRYRLLFQLGAGGMAEVFLAHEEGQAGVERLVVIKRVLPHLATDDLFINMLLNEARISTRLNHPNIAHVYEVGEHNGQTFIAMEFVHGVSLRSVLRRRSKVRLYPPLAVLVASKVAAALHHAHTLTDLRGVPLGVVHRDISPDNIHISYEGVVKVLDFGIAKAKTNVEDTTSGVLKGKYTYMAPEQARMEAVDQRTDLFALGIVLHEMLTYKKLFRREGRDPSVVLREITECRVPPPSLVAGIQIPPELDQIVIRALQRDPSHRYGSAREMLEDLLAFLKKQPATDMDLEACMVQLFGDVEAHRQKLRAAVEQQHFVPELGPGTPSESLPTWSGESQPSVSGSVVAGESRPPAVAPARRGQRWILWASLALLVLASVAGVWTWRGGKDKTTAPPTPVAVRPAPPDVTRPDLSIAKPAPVGPAQLIIKTTPPGATVLLDGRLAPGRTPTVVRDVPAGTRQLTLALKRHKELSFAVELSPGEVKEIQRDLTAFPRPPRHPRVPPRPTGTGLLTINATPWAEVYVDGKRVGVTPLVRLRLPAGPHTIRLRNPNRNLEKTMTVTVPKDGEVKRVTTL